MKIIKKTPVSIRLSGPETGRINGIKLLYPFPDEMDSVSDAAKEAARKKIHVELPKKGDFEKELFPSTTSPGVKAASEFEKDVFEYALQNRTLKVYVLTFQKIISDESSCRWELHYGFQKEREAALEVAKSIKEREKTEATIKEHDFTDLVTMSEAEFESLPSDKNYNLVKMYRETMRNILSPEEQND